MNCQYFIQLKRKKKTQIVNFNQNAKFYFILFLKNTLKTKWNLSRQTKYLTEIKQNGEWERIVKKGRAKSKKGRKRNEKKNDKIFNNSWNFVSQI
jgi:hypothetical protein